MHTLTWTRNAGYANIHAYKKGSTAMSRGPLKAKNSSAIKKEDPNLLSVRKWSLSVVTLTVDNILICAWEENLKEKWIIFLKNKRYCRPQSETLYKI